MRLFVVGFAAPVDDEDDEDVEMFLDLDIAEDVLLLVLLLIVAVGAAVGLWRIEGTTVRWAILVAVCIRAIFDGIGAWVGSCLFGARTSFIRKSHAERLLLIFAF